MPEHLAFEKALRKSAEVDLHKWLLRTRAVRMDRLGNQLLPCSALAGYQDGGVGRSDPGNRTQHLHQRSALAYDLVKMKFIIGIQAVQRCFLLLLLFAQFDRRTDGFQQHKIVPGFGHKIESACLHSLHGKRNRSPCRHQDHRNVGLEDLHLLQQLYAFFTGGGQRKVHIHQDKLRRRPAYDSQRFFRSRNSIRLEPGPFQQEG